MKPTKFFIAQTITFLLFAAACSKEDNTSTERDRYPYEESIVIIQYTKEIDSGPDSPLIEYVIITEIIDFSNEIPLSDVYNIDGIEYCDNGLFLDQKANDGIYTSVFSLTAPKEVYDTANMGVILNLNDNFRYRKELDEYVVNWVKQDCDLKKSMKIKLGCNVRWADCPNTNWLNTSLFGERCIEFYDCHASIEIEF